MRPHAGSSREAFVELFVPPRQRIPGEALLPRAAAAGGHLGTALSISEELINQLDDVSRGGADRPTREPPRRCDEPAAPRLCDLHGVAPCEGDEREAGGH